jgi:hypothetical protein
MPAHREIDNTPRPSLSRGGRWRLWSPASSGRLSAQMVLCVFVLGASLSGGLAGDGVVQERPASQAARRPASRPGRVVAFQPGVNIDWSEPAVRVAGRVVQQSGPLEFLACFPGKEHESVVLLEASAQHVYLALGLIGLSPGEPPVWDEERGVFRSPRGDLVDVSFEWGSPEQPETAEAHLWLREIEYGRAPLARPWVFAGSYRLGDGALAADRTGSGLALVTFPDSLLALSRGRSSRDVELWAAAAPDAVPPRGTPVQLVLRPARARTHALRLDFRGAAFVDGRYTAAEDLADLLRLSRQLAPEAVHTILVEGALQSDVARLRHVLIESGVAAQAFRFSRPAPSDTQPGRPADSRR